MYKIDLLKGQGVPIKARPEGIAVFALTFAVPLVLALVLTGIFLANQIEISVAKKSLVMYETNLGRMTGTLDMKKQHNSSKQFLNSCFLEISENINNHTQWSPILLDLIENVPDSLLLENLEVTQDFKREKVPHKTDPEKKIEISVPYRTLHITLTSDAQQNNDAIVKQFRQNLSKARSLVGKLQELRVSQEADLFGSSEAVYYKIDCVLKPGC